MLEAIEGLLGRTRRPGPTMKLRHIAVLSLTTLVIISGATTAMAAQGGNPLDQASSSQQSSSDNVDRDGDINVTVAGDVAPGNEVVLTATHDDQPIRFASVTVNGEDVGETDANGSITVQVPNTDELEIEVTADDLEAEMEIDFEDTEDGDHDSDDEDDDDEDDAETDGDDEEDHEDEG